MKSASVSAVKANLDRYLEDDADSPLVITRDGRPVAVLVPASDEVEIERLVLAYSPKLQRLLQERAESIARDGGVSHDEIWETIDTASRAAPRRKR